MSDRIRFECVGCGARYDVRRPESAPPSAILIEATNCPACAETASHAYYDALSRELVLGENGELVIA